VAQEIDALNSDIRGYLNRRTGELFTVPAEWFDDAEFDVWDDLDEQSEDGGELADEADAEPQGKHESGDHQPDWERDLAAKIREIENSEDWIDLPVRESYENYKVMERFCTECCEGDVQVELLRAISGRGAFRRFKDLIDRYGIAQQWYDLKYRELEAYTARWLEAEGISFTA
jgi:hypothetical protein